jgi:hypothetical protein
MGTATACGALGTATATPATHHFVRWTVNATLYTPLPTLEVQVNSNKATLTASNDVTCSQGGSSVPIVVSASALPFTDVKVTLKKSVSADEAKTDLSVGITPNTGETVTLKVGETSGVLGFKWCAATVDKTKKAKLTYVVAGTDASQFTMTLPITVTAIARPATQPTAKLDFKMETTSTAASTTMSALCPGQGSAWMSF